MVATSRSSLILFTGAGGHVKQFAIKVTAVSPLAIRADHAPGGAATAAYIPGTTFMGSLAAVHRLLRPDNADDFANFFLRDKVRYPHLYPASFKSSSMQESFLPIYCIPKTAQTCKQFGGFPLLADEDDDNERHGVRDSLFDWAVFTLSYKTRAAQPDKYSDTFVIKALEEHKTCDYLAKERQKTCGQPLDHVKGYYRRSSDGKLATAKAETRLLTRTGINRRYGIVEESILYSREVFTEGTGFFGNITVDDDVYEAFKAFLLENSNSDVLLINHFARLGTGRTRGFGKVLFDVSPSEDIEDNFEAFKQRLQAFDTALRAQVREFGLEPPHRFYIALTLHAATMLCDDLLRYEGTITGKQLARQVRLPDDLFELLYQSASMQRVMGWQELWGLPRAHAYAIEAGSVFLYAVAQPLDDAWAHPLFELEQHGIGQRRAEGFGRVCVSDLFHLEGKLR
jgi:CRISPR-associated protein Csx10